jgi:hypothetical protein
MQVKNPYDWREYVDKEEMALERDIIIKEKAK